MRVILLRDVKNVGGRWEVVEAADGYARNFLVARGLALPATSENLTKRDQSLRHQESEQREAEQQARQAAREPLVFHVKTGVKGEVFGSVSAADIERALAERGYRGVRVHLERPIKTTGDQPVVVKFPSEVETTITVRVQS